MTEYQSAKKALLGENCPLSGWRTSGVRWESFDVNSEYVAENDLGHMGNNAFS
jgi:tRNA-specific adenosine deaminase 1